MKTSTVLRQQTLIGLHASARFSKCGLYRYVLTRTWDDERPPVCFIGLNPSIATEKDLDPTIRRCIGFAKSWGAGGIVMLNAFAIIDPKPAVMKAAGAEAIGPENDFWIRKHARLSSEVVVCWGTDGTYREREAALLQLLKRIGVTVKCLGKTKDGFPRHPLYLRKDTPLINY